MTSPALPPDVIVLAGRRRETKAKSKRATLCLMEEVPGDSTTGRVCVIAEGPNVKYSRAALVAGAKQRWKIVGPPAGETRSTGAARNPLPEPL